jgi:hypothetical protein
VTGRSHSRLGRFCGFSLAIISILSPGVSSSLAQILEHEASTELLIKRYEELATDGSLLTPDGWARASKLFERSDAYPADGEILLISAPAIIGETERNGDRAKVQTKWGDYFGKIDSLLRYNPSSARGAILFGSDSFSLVLVHRRPGATGDSGSWLVEGPLRTRSADIPHAIRYVERMRDRSNDPMIRRNADKTITALTPLIAPVCGSATAC